MTKVFSVLFISLWFLLKTSFFFSKFLFKYLLNLKVLATIVIALLAYIFIFGKFIPEKIPFKEFEQKYNLPKNDLKAIMRQESAGEFLVVNTNDRNLMSYFFKGSKYFSTELQAFLYMNVTLDTFRQNYDIGPFQINSNWIKKKSIEESSLELMNPFKSIDVSAKILSDNYIRCRNKGFKDLELSKCAYSTYNTGEPHTKSKTGTHYAEKILNHHRVISNNTYNYKVMYIPLYGYIKI